MSAPKYMINIEQFADPSLERHFTGHSQGITQVRFCPEGNKVATSSLGKL